MNYVSTRDHNKTVTAAQAIAAGISSEGGLFVPESFPPLTVDELRTLVPMDYRARAAFVLSRFLTDFSTEEVKACVDAAYTAEKFGDHPAPLHTLHDNAHVLELWHGPTCAFKDMALQILPHLMRVSVAKSVPGKEIVILVATSGDTGKAALEGFKDAPHTRILVFYPVDGVRRETTSPSVPFAATLTTPSPASRRSSPIPPSRKSWRRTTCCFQAPTPSTGDGWCRRWCIISPPIAIS